SLAITRRQNPRLPCQGCKPCLRAIVAPGLVPRRAWWNVAPRRHKLCFAKPSLGSGLRAAEQAGRLRLLARGGIPMKCPPGRRPVDRAHELAMLGDRTLLVALGNGSLQASRQRLDRRAVAQVLEPLASCGPDALFLLFDVRHDVKTPASRAARS